MICINPEVIVDEAQIQCSIFNFKHQWCNTTSEIHPTLLPITVTPFFLWLHGHEYPSYDWVFEVSRFSVCACKHIPFSETWISPYRFLRKINMLARVLWKKPGYCCIYTSYPGFWLLPTTCAAVASAKWRNRNTNNGGSESMSLLWRWRNSFVFSN